MDLSTARKWKRGARVPPASALLLLARDLGCFASQWAGWTVNGEDLVSPEGWTVNRNDALIVPLMHAQISALRSEISNLKDAAEGMEEQPLPGALPSSITA